MRNSASVSPFTLVLFIAVLLLCAPAAWATEPGGSLAPPVKARAAKRSIVAQDPCTRITPINFGVDATGTLATGDCRLSDNSFADFYAFTGRGGQQIAISLSSTGFDTYLFLLDADENVIEDDDDGGGGTNSRIPATTGFLTLPSTGIYIIVANSFGPGETGDYTLRLTTTGALPPAAISAASFTGTQLAPNSIVAVFGENLATGTAAAPGLPLPTTLAGTRVDIVSGGVTTPASLFFASPGQVNILMPAGIASGAARVRITNSNGTTVEGFTVIAAVGPGLFTANANGQGVPSAIAVRVAAGGAQTFEAVAQLESGRFVPRPINLGPAGETVILVLYGTGIRGRTSLTGVRVTIGGTNAEVQFAGAQGDFVGLDQLNAVIPRSLVGRGEVDVVLTVDGRVANLVLADNRLASIVRIRIQ